MDRLTAPNRQGQTSLVINKRLKAESFGYPRDYRVDRRSKFWARDGEGELRFQNGGWMR